MTKKEFDRKTENLRMLEEYGQGDVPIAKALRIALARSEHAAK